MLCRGLEALLIQVSFLLCCSYQLVLIQTFVTTGLIVAQTFWKALRVLVHLCYCHSHLCKLDMKCYLVICVHPLQKSTRKELRHEVQKNEVLQTLPVFESGRTSLCQESLSAVKDLEEQYLKTASTAQAANLPSMGLAEQVVTDGMRPLLT